MSKYKKIKEFEPEKAVTTVLLVESIEECKTKNNGSYCKIQMTDGESRIVAKLWNSEKANLNMSEGGLATVTVNVGTYMGQPDYKIQNYADPPLDADIKEFIMSAPMDTKEMYQRILAVFRKYTEGQEKTTITEIVEALYGKYMEKLLYWSAAKSVHHACYGGLLYHTYRMAMAAQYLGRLYKLDMELLLGGILLHDIGKLEELDTSPIGVADYTPDGEMFGHALIGIRMVEGYVHEAIINGEQVDTNRVKALEHIIASHHGNLEWGAIAKPMIPEAAMVHYIDNLDAQMYQYEETRATLEPGTMSDRVFGLGSRVLAKDLTE